MHAVGCGEAKVIFGLGPMNLVMARSIALAGAVALSGAWMGGSAQAVPAPSCALAPGASGAFAFGCTGSSADYATLTLQVGGKTVVLSTNGFQGWVSDSSFNINIGGPIGANTNYMVGVYNGVSYNDYFGFDLSRLGSTATVTSATLTLHAGLIDQKLNLSLFGATQWISELDTGSGVNAALFRGLATGREYDPSVLSANTTDLTVPLVFTLNGMALTDINAAIRSPTQLFAISGHADLADAVPEPSTWMLMLAGFAGLGFVARRRAARRRAAAS
jgi:PEP-CTERM motif-containing protein